MQIIGMKGRAYLLHSVAESLQMDTDKLVPSLDMIAKQEGAAQGQGSEAAMQAQAIQQQAEQQIAEIQQQAQEQIAALQEQVQTLSQQLNNKQDELGIKADTEIEKAKISAQATVQAAQIAASSSNALDPIEKQIRDTQQDIAELRIEEAAKMMAIQKDIQAVKLENENAGMAKVMAYLEQIQSSLNGDKPEKKSS